MRLFGFLRPDRALVDQLSALEKRVAVLEGEMHPARLVEWHDLAERLKRYLSRIAAVEQKAKQREEGHHDADPVTSAVLRSKFPKLNGG
jgi:hypothetical protein